MIRPVKFTRLIEIVNSCKTPEQLKTAATYARLSFKAELRQENLTWKRGFKILDMKSEFNDFLTKKARELDR